MRCFFFSDIHGSVGAAEKILLAAEREKCDLLVFLGDLLYHGPRNSIPNDYDPKKVAALFNQLQKKPICSRGNCDSEVDGMVLDFPIFMECNLIVDGSVKFFSSHGHIFSPPKIDGSAPCVQSSALPPIKFLQGEKMAYFFGHTHIQTLYKVQRGEYSSAVVCNPGSPTFPKENSPKGYALYDSGAIFLKTLEGKITNQIEL